MIELVAHDGHRLSAWRADPAGTPKGGVVVVQEIFGVNNHIRAVTEGFAAAGWLAIAPALFDRSAKGIELGYDQDGIAKGREIAFGQPQDAALADVAAAIGEVRRLAGSAAVVGYCWGGTLAWLSATRLGADAAVGYYGGGIAKTAGEAPKAPVMLHFGETDHAIPMTDVEAIKVAQLAIPVHVYPAGHGFNCSESGSFHAPSAELAQKRTLAFLDAIVAKA
jgi:carboxymethylenebutenolidase